MADLGPEIASFSVTACIDKFPPAACRLYVPTDTLYALRCAPGSLKIARYEDCSAPAEIWPSSRLRMGTAAPSYALVSALGDPVSGSLLHIYDLPQGTAVTNICCSSLKLRLFSAVPAGALSARTTPEPVGPSKGTNSSTERTQGKRGGRQIFATPPSMKGSRTPSVTPNLLGSTDKTNGQAEASTSSEMESVKSLSAKARTNELQKEIAMELLQGRFRDRGEDTMSFLALQALKDRYIIEGTTIRIPFMGLDVQLKVEELHGVERGALARIAENAKVTIIPVDAGIEMESNIAQRAAEAAEASLGGGMDGPAAQAAFQAAAAGARSLGQHFSHLGGLQNQMEILEQMVTAPLRHFEQYARYFLSPPTGVLLHGPPGTGKTALARATASEAGASLFLLNGPDIVSEYLGESETCLRAIFEAAKALAPSVVFIDEADALAPARSASTSGASTRIVTTLLTELDSLKGHPVVVLAATNRLEALDESLRRPGRLDRELSISVPTEAERIDIFSKLMAPIQHNLSDQDIGAFAADAYGFVGADLAAVCREAAMAALRRAVLSNSLDALSVTLQDIEYAKRMVKPSALREIAIETPKLSWSDVGGMDDIKQQLREVVEWPRTHNASLKRLGAVAPKGVLLFGPPGCSKTMLAKAVAREAKMNFLAIKGPELLNKYVGESEKALREYFRKARSSSPSILFFDEIDGLVGARVENEGHAGGVDISERILSQLLQEMDGLQVSSVVVIAATNRPDNLDPALLRPGRFDRLLYLPLPSIENRLAILQVQLSKVPIDSNMSLRLLAEKCEGYSGADLGALCQRAALVALERDASVAMVQAIDFEKAFTSITPTAALLDEHISCVYEAFNRKVT